MRTKSKSLRPSDLTIEEIQVVIANYAEGRIPITEKPREVFDREARRRFQVRLISLRYAVFVVFVDEPIDARFWSLATIRQLWRPAHIRQFPGLWQLCRSLNPKGE